MKKCNKCLLDMPLSEFYAATKGGLQSRCKACTREAVKANRLAKAEYYRAYDRIRYYDHGYRAPICKAALARGAKAWEERNPGKRAAQVAVNNAVRDGRLKKLEHCEDCGGENERIHGHHEDYSKQLEVVWLCPPCHSKRHRKYDVEETSAYLAAARSARKSGKRL
jgi:hypothetical protein